MTTYPNATIDVLARGEGYSVARITGNKMPFLILCPQAIIDLGRLFGAAARRARALPDSQTSDAIVEFERSFNALLSQYDAALAAYGETLMEATDCEAAHQELKGELRALQLLGEPPEENEAR